MVALVDYPVDAMHLAMPDIEDPCEFEEFAYIAGSVWAAKTGVDPWKDAKASFPYTGDPPAAEPSGTPFEEDEDHLAKRDPKLWARFGDSPL